MPWETRQNQFPELSSFGLASSADLSERTTTEMLQDERPTVVMVLATVAADHWSSLPSRRSRVEPVYPYRKHAETEMTPQPSPEASCSSVPDSFSEDGWPSERAPPDTH